MKHDHELSVVQLPGGVVARLGIEPRSQLCRSRRRPSGQAIAAVRSPEGMPRHRTALANRTLHFGFWRPKSVQQAPYNWCTGGDMIPVRRTFVAFATHPGRRYVKSLPGIVLAPEPAFTYACAHPESDRAIYVRNVEFSSTVERMSFVRGVPLAGVEPAPRGLQDRCATSYASGAFALGVGVEPTVGLLRQVNSLLPSPIGHPRIILHPFPNSVVADTVLLRHNSVRKGFNQAEQLLFGRPRCNPMSNSTTRVRTELFVFRGLSANSARRASRRFPYTPNAPPSIPLGSVNTLQQVSNLNTEWAQVFAGLLMVDLTMTVRTKQVAFVQLVFDSHPRP